MRTTAMVLGIVGGIFGIFAAVFALAVGGLSSSLNVEGGGKVVGLGYAAFFVSVLAIVGGALAGKKPKAAALILLIAGIGGFVCVSAFWLLSGPLLLIGALLAFLGRKSDQSTVLPPVYYPPYPYQRPQQNQWQQPNALNEQPQHGSDPYGQSPGLLSYPPLHPPHLPPPGDPRQ
ncbi:MAG: DUF4064 domain-containing protein [Chloroflexota bacterium]|nr:DUF4064 domain-containing protein [Chloroflexota bacterium]